VNPQSYPQDLWIKGPTCQFGLQALFFRALQPPTRGWASTAGHDDMKPDTHPKYNEIKVICSCGNEFQTKSTLSDELHIDVCSACHPFYTGTQKIVDTAGRVDKFRRKYGLS
jgi:large subunit ribosomal protein L31